MPTDRIDTSLEDDGGEESETANLLPGDAPVEPGEPALENVVFVVLGIAIALAVVARLVMLYG
ncbi:MAG: hypothetical protein ABEH59_10705 [Halobacteriales archaeon]